LAQIRLVVFEQNAKTA